MKQWGYYIIILVIASIFTSSLYGKTDLSINPGVLYAENSPDVDKDLDSMMSPKLSFQDKSLYAAFLLSGVVGFGSGNFYADNPMMGYIFFMTDIVAVGLLAGGIASLMMATEYNLMDTKVTAGEGLFYAGVATFSGLRVFQIITSVKAAYRYNKRNMYKDDRF